MELNVRKRHVREKSKNKKARKTHVGDGWADVIRSAQLQTTYTVAGKEVRRMRYGYEQDDWGPTSDSCPVCEVMKGWFHVIECDVEPCGGQVVACNCCDEVRTPRGDAKLPQPIEEKAVIASELESGIFGLGRIIATSDAWHTLHPEDVFKSLGRHERCDWGDCGSEDVQENKFALGKRLRLFSVYHDRNGVKFWIITEADRSVTTVLLPEDY
jgi:hypothetical protein